MQFSHIKPANNNNNQLINIIQLMCQCQCQSKFFSVAKIAELLRSPQRRSRVTIQKQEIIVEKEMF